MFKFKKRTKKVMASLLAILMLSASICNYTTASAAYITVTAYEYNETFTWRSIPEPVTVELDCDTVSFYATCQGEEIDNVTCYIVDLSNDGLYSDTFAFDADGNVTTYLCSFPAGRYKVYFVGSADITKTSACVLFAKEE